MLVESGYSLLCFWKELIIFCNIQVTSMLNWLDLIECIINCFNNCLLFHQLEKIDLLLTNCPNNCLLFHQLEELRVLIKLNFLIRVENSYRLFRLVCRWKRWLRRTTTMSCNFRPTTEEKGSSLKKIMNSVGRNFVKRLWMAWPFATIW